MIDGVSSSSMTGLFKKAALRDAIAKLRPTLRNVVNLYDLQECSLHETTEALGISVAAAKGVSCTSRATQDSRPYFCIRG